MPILIRDYHDELSAVMQNKDQANIWIFIPSRVEVTEIIRIYIRAAQPQKWH